MIAQELPDAWAEIRIEIILTDDLWRVEVAIVMYDEWEPEDFGIVDPCDKESLPGWLSDRDKELIDDYCRFAEVIRRCMGSCAIDDIRRQHETET